MERVWGVALEAWIITVATMWPVCMPSIIPRDSFEIESRKPIGSLEERTAACGVSACPAMMREG